MEILGTAGLLAFGTAFYNRDNFLYDLGQQQAKTFKALQFKVARFAQYRTDVTDLLLPIINVTNSVTTWSALMLTTAVTLIGTADLISRKTKEKELEEKEFKPTEEWVRSIWMTSTVASIGFLFIAKWLAYHAVVSAQCYSTKMLLQFVRLPLPTKEELDGCVHRASEFEDKEANEIFRVPVLNKAHAPVSSHETEKIEERRKEEEVEDMDEDHIKLFRQLRLNWRTYEVYSRMALTGGIVSLLHALSFYLIAYCVRFLESWWSASASVVLLAMGTMQVMGLELLQRDWTIVVYIAGPICVLVIYCIDGMINAPKDAKNVLFIRISAAIPFFVEALWPVVFFNGMRSSKTSWRFIQFIDVFDTFGGRQVLDPIQREAFHCKERLTQLAQECALRHKDPAKTESDRFINDNTTLLINRSMAKLERLLPKQKAPVRQKHVISFTENPKALKELVLREEQVILTLERESEKHAQINEPNPLQDECINAPYRSVKLMCLFLSFVYIANGVYQIIHVSVDPHHSHVRRRLISESNEWGVTPPESRFHSCSEGFLELHNTTHVFHLEKEAWTVAYALNHSLICDAYECNGASSQTEPHFQVVSGEVVAYKSYVGKLKAYAAIRPFNESISCHTVMRKTIRKNSDGSSDIPQHLLAVLGKGVKIFDATKGKELLHIDASFGRDVCLDETRLYLLTDYSTVQTMVLYL